MTEPVRDAVDIGNDIRKVLSLKIPDSVQVFLVASDIEEAIANDIEDLQRLRQAERLIRRAHEERGAAYCSCYDHYPCATIRYLDGEEA